MGPFIALGVIALASLLVVRVASHALVMTGLSLDTASFQAVSAFFGVGFTTREAELVMNHPVRRRIIRDLIILGNIGLTSALATIVVSMVAFDNSWERVLYKLGVLLGSAVIFWLVWKIGFVRTAIDWSIQRSIRRLGRVRIPDYEVLLRAQDGYTIAECALEPDHPLVNKSLGEVKLRNQGVVVLGISRPDGTYIGVPHGDARMESGDVLTVYGRDESLRKGLFVPPEPAETVQAHS